MRRARAGLVAATLLLACSALPSPARADDVGGSDAGRVEIRDASVDVAQALGLARVGLARPDLAAPVAFAGPEALPPVSGALVRGGFGLGAFSVLRDEPIAGRANARLATGLLGHEDLFGRTEWSHFAAGFVRRGRKVTIHSARIEPYHPLAPTVRFAFVPAAAAPEGFLDERYTSVSLMRFLYEAAVPASGIEPGDHYAIAVFMDRLSSRARVRLTAGPDPEGTHGKGKGRLIVSDDGWFAVGRRLRVDPTAPTYLKAVVVPPGRDAIVASLLSTADLRD